MPYTTGNIDCTRFLQLSVTPASGFMTLGHQERYGNFPRGDYKVCQRVRTADESARQNDSYSARRIRRETCYGKVGCFRIFAVEVLDFSILEANKSCTGAPGEKSERLAQKRKQQAARSLEKKEDKKTQHVKARFRTGEPGKSVEACPINAFPRFLNGAKQCWCICRGSGRPLVNYSGSCNT